MIDWNQFRRELQHMINCYGIDEHFNQSDVDLACFLIRSLESLDDYIQMPMPEDSKTE